MLRKVAYLFNTTAKRTKKIWRKNKIKTKINLLRTKTTDDK